MDDYPVRPKDIVLQSVFPKRLVIALGEHVEFYVDAKVVLKMLNLMREARHENDDLDDGKLRVEYSSDSTDQDFCMIRFDDFSICRLTTEEFDNLEKGFAEFFRWTAEYKMPISDFFMYKVK